MFRLTYLRVTYIHFSLAAFPPNFAKYPLLPNQYGTVQGNVTIMCRAEGAPRPEIVWFKDGGRLSVSEQPSARVRKLANGWLFINNVQIGDQGIYKCEARNTFGKVSSEGNLTILSKWTSSLFSTSVQGLRQDPSYLSFGQVVS